MMSSAPPSLTWIDAKSYTNEQRMTIVNFQRFVKSKSLPIYGELEAGQVWDLRDRSHFFWWMHEKGPGKLRGTISVEDWSLVVSCLYVVGVI